MMNDVLHLMTQDNQPYGSSRKCCEKCGKMIEGDMLYTDDRGFYNHESAGGIGLTRCNHSDVVCPDTVVVPRYPDAALAWRMIVALSAAVGEAAGEPTEEELQDAVKAVTAMIAAAGGE